MMSIVEKSHYWFANALQVYASWRHVTQSCARAIIHKKLNAIQKCSGRDIKKDLCNYDMTKCSWLVFLDTIQRRRNRQFLTSNLMHHKISVIENDEVQVLRIQWNRRTRSVRIRMDRINHYVRNKYHEQLESLINSSFGNRRDSMKVTKSLTFGIYALKIQSITWWKIQDVIMFSRLVLLSDTYRNASSIICICSVSVSNFV